MSSLLINNFSFMILYFLFCPLFSKYFDHYFVLLDQTISVVNYYYSVIQSDQQRFCCDVVLDSVNMAFDFDRKFFFYKE